MANFFLSNEKVVKNTTRSERAYKTSVYQRREDKIKYSNIANNRASLLHKSYDVDIGPAGSAYFTYVGTGNVRASRTGPGPNIP